MSIPQQSAGAGRWVPAREFAEQSNLVNWNTLSPRFGLSWDVFGDGRTAVKGGLSKYDRLAGITIIQPLNGKNIAFQTCPWADDNGDLRAQESEIAFPRCTGSLQPSLGYVDPGLKRPYQWEYTASVQRQIGGRTVGPARVLRPQVLGSLHDGERLGAARELLAPSPSPTRSRSSR
jgi:hypothetical protein